jgi:hypothetical protein
MMKDIQIQKFAFHNENKTGQFYKDNCVGKNFDLIN